MTDPVATGEVPADRLLVRVDQVQRRLQDHADAPPVAGLTDPDPPTGERWDWGQVWGHLGEFVPYWCGEVRLIISAQSGEPVPTGRTKSDVGRLAAIEADRDRPTAEMMTRLAGHLDELRGLIREMTVEDWARRGMHSTLGEMGMPYIFEEFLVGHLEGHADQLDALRRDGAG